ncbi:MAG: M23 family metallopeptidase [Candidatus Rokubacteria bacterium]|nr:M23 family metallopeptidase [Candidatus Rokubacteria bacterium]
MTRYGGLHGGVDITLAEGTPLRALAAGRVISAGEGGLAVGTYVWLQHSPQDTGLPFWIYSKYQHLLEPSSIPVGEPVRTGQIVGLSGKTGTSGRHYGPAGYPHLHLTTLASPSGEYEIRGSTVFPVRSQIFDPVAVYAEWPGNLDELARLPGNRKDVPIPYVSEEGSLHPAGTSLVWPVACKRR